MVVKRKYQVGIRRLVVAAVMVLLGATEAVAQRYGLPTVPDTIREVGARADWVTARFWEAYDFRDTTLLRQDYAEQAMADFLGLLPYASAAGQETAVARWLDGAAVCRQTYDYFADQAEAYLRRTDSPMYDAKLYRLVARHVADNEAAGEAQRSRARLQLRLLDGNAVGDRAADISFTHRDGREGRLSAIVRQGPVLLLFFDPDCTRCRDLLFRLRHSSAVNGAVADGRLRVVAVCTEATDDDWAWTADDLPPQWTVVRDNGAEGAASVYDLTRLPQLYLIDGEGRVVLRETGIHEVTALLTSGWKG